MNLSAISNNHMQAIARWMLVLFVLAWVNLAIQAPVHAAMKQNQQDTSCHCQPKLCDTVLSMEQQSDEALSTLLSMSLDFKVAFIAQIDIQPVTDLISLRWQFQTHQYRQTSPPPLLLKTVLLI
ncbi:MAG: hypothetical protein ACN4GM_06255 [Gammaproteobacteria bacterium]